MTQLWAGSDHYPVYFNKNIDEHAVKIFEWSTMLLPLWKRKVKGIEQYERDVTSEMIVEMSE